MKEGKEIEIIISEIDLYFIDKVRELRGKAQPYISQVELSQRMGYADGYIGKVENLSSNSRYNIRKLNLVAKALGLKSYQALLPEQLLENDLVYYKIRLNSRKNDMVDFDSNGDVIKNYQILEKRVLTEDEIKKYNNRRSIKTK